MAMVCQRHPLAAFPREKDPVPITQEAEWDPGSVWTGVGNKKFSAPAGV
jgi:hypothetical protein